MLEQEPGSQNRELGHTALSSHRYRTCRRDYLQTSQVAGNAVECSVSAIKNTKALLGCILMFKYDEKVGYELDCTAQSQ